MYTYIFYSHIYTQNIYVHTNTMTIQNAGKDIEWQDPQYTVTENTELYTAL